MAVPGSTVPNQGESTPAGSPRNWYEKSPRKSSGLDVDKLLADAGSAAVQSQVERNLLQFQADGAEGTPTLLIDIVDDDDPPYTIQIGLDPEALSAALDDALEG